MTFPDLGKMGESIRTRLTTLESTTSDHGTRLTSVEGSVSANTTTLSKKANSASPTLTGTPKAPTAKQGTNTTQVATCAFVIAETSAVQTYAEAIADAFASFNTTHGIK